MTAGVALRPVAPDDESFLFALYASTREEELRVTGWGETQREAFLAMQWAAQQRHYGEHFAAASRHVVEVDGEPAGRLYVSRTAGELHVVDISLLPRFRGRGIGGTLLARVCDESDALGAMTSIYVEHRNPARGLYERLGFRLVNDEGVYLRMERPAAAAIAQPNTTS